MLSVMDLSMPSVLRRAPHGTQSFLQERHWVSGLRLVCLAASADRTKCGNLVPPAGFPCSAHAPSAIAERNISNTSSVKSRLNTSAVLIHSQVCNTPTPLREKQNTCVGSNWFSPGCQACLGVWSDWLQEGVFWRRSNRCQ